MSEKSFRKSEFKRTIDLGKTDRGQDTDLIRVWRESSGEEKAISLGDINGGLIGDYVPYTGAVDNVNLGEKGISVGYVKYDTTPTSTPTDQGTSYWDIDDNTLAIIMNGTTLKVGEDQYYPVKNQTGVLIPKGTAVRFAGTLGASGRLLIAPFIADGSVPSSRFMGVTSEDIDNGEDGKVMWFGRIRGINTNAFNEGDILYASTTVAGGFQTTIPVAPNNIVQVCAVINKSVSNGIIFVRPTFASNINKDEGVKLTSLADKDLLQYQIATGLWENKSLATIGLITGSGTINQVPKFTGVGTIGDSAISDSGTLVTINSPSKNSGSLITQSYLLPDGTTSSLNIGSLFDYNDFTNATSSFLITHPSLFRAFVIGTSTGGVGINGVHSVISGRRTTSGSLQLQGFNAIVQKGTSDDASTAGATNAYNANIGHLISLNNSVVSNPINTLTSIIQIQKGSGTVVNGFNQTLNVSTVVASSGTVGTYAGLRTAAIIGRADGTTVGTVTTFYDAYFGGATVNTGSSITNRWGVYQDNVLHPNYFAASLWIGTTSGTNTLDVNGTARIRTISNLGSAATSVLVPSATGVVSLRTVSELRTDIGAIGGSGTTNYLSKFTGSGTIGDSAVFESGGNVGIGTASPNILGFGRVVSVQDSGSPAFALIIGTTSTADIVATTEGTFISTRTSTPLILQTNNLERARITSSGNFLIGTTTDSGHRLNVNGEARIQAINNLGVSATSVLVPSATGVLSLRTLAELASDGGFANLWTLTGSDIYRNSAVAIGRTTIPFGSTFSVQSLTISDAQNFYQILNNAGSLIFSINGVGSGVYNGTYSQNGNLFVTSTTSNGIQFNGIGGIGVNPATIFRGHDSNGGRILASFGSQSGLFTSIFYDGTILMPRSSASNRAIRRDELYLNYSETVATAGTLNDLAINASTKLLILTGATDLTGVVPVDDTRLLRIEARTASRIIRHESASSAAANRFSIGADLTINAGEVYQFIYTDSRWRRVL